MTGDKLGRSENNTHPRFACTLAPLGSCKLCGDNDWFMPFASLIRANHRATTYGHAGCAQLCFGSRSSMMIGVPVVVRSTTLSAEHAEHSLESLAPWSGPRESQPERCVDLWLEQDGLSWRLHEEDCECCLRLVVKGTFEHWSLAHWGRTSPFGDVEAKAPAVAGETDNRRFVPWLDKR